VAFACEYCEEPLTTRRGYLVSRPGFELSASECKSKCRPTCCRTDGCRREQCQLCCEPVYLFHTCPIDGASSSRANQQRCPAFRSARFLQIRIVCGVTSECVAGVVVFVLYGGRLVSKILFGLFTLVGITKLLQWCAARCHKCEDVQSDVAVLIISRSVLLRVRCVSEKKVVEKIKTHIYGT
jgi:hypothetical protein